MGNPVPILFARRTLMYVVNIIYLERIGTKEMQKETGWKTGRKPAVQ